MRREKVVIINSCEQCPFYNFDDSFHVHKWGKHWCDKLNEDLGDNPYNIPPNCPLPDKEPIKNDNKL